MYKNVHPIIRLALTLSIISASFMKEPKKQSLEESAIIIIIIIVVIITIIIIIILGHLLVWQLQA